MSLPRGTLDQWLSALLEGAAELGLSLSQAISGQFRLHLELLLEHNARAGLTTITDPAAIAIKHFLDSLTVLLVKEIAEGQRVADVGSGGGFPGAALAAARPQARYTLIESNQKRAAFLRTLVEAQGWRHVSVLAARAEDVGRQPGHREQYDLVVSRALAPVRVLAEYCLPLVAVGGEMIAGKGPGVEVELGDAESALSTLGGRLKETSPFSLPQGMGDRVLVLVEKVAPTPGRYPRRPGLPAKRPL